MALECNLPVCIKIGTFNSHSAFILPPLCHPPFSPSSHLLTPPLLLPVAYPASPSSPLRSLSTVTCSLLNPSIPHVSFLNHSFSQDTPYIFPAKKQEMRTQHGDPAFQGCCHKSVIFTDMLGELWAKTEGSKHARDLSKQIAVSRDLKTNPFICASLPQDISHATSFF